jgi:TRAP transporter 4TM/12TM fusion protein
MAEPSAIPDVSQKEIEKQIEEIEYTGRKHGPRMAIVVGVIAFVWSVFQLWIASPFPFMANFGIIFGAEARSIHLAFGLLLCYLMFPAARRFASRPIGPVDLAVAVFACYTALYIYIAHAGLVERRGIPLTIELLGFDFPFESVLGGLGIVLLLEATRRAIGLPLVIVASVFLIYSVFGQSMPDIISHRGVSLNRLIGYQWLGQEAIFGIPIDVSVSFVFLFVLFGALLDKAGAGRYFLDLAFALVGRFRGGPAKAAILASGMTGAISGSSIANVVTTGTFTIPVMVRTGFPATKAGAIEVAASTNGQIMPPIMGAAAFVMAELLGISYFDVIKAAFIPAVVSYIALFYISHLEAMKLGLKGLPKKEIPPLMATFKSGLHFLIPILVLVYLLMVERWSAGSAVFYSIMLLMVIILIERVWHEMRTGEADAGGAVKDGLQLIYDGMVAGARNMVNIAIAVASAGIIVGAVSSTGLNNALVGVVEAISGGNVYIMLGLTAVLCLILGMGLPTTANYLVVASILAGVLVELGQASGLILPLIAVHLFVFYFGILADDTPPVCLAAFAAAAISRADPIKTGIQGFTYDIRTAILPFIFIFNPELLLIGVETVWEGLLIFFIALLAMAAFSAATQGWFLVRTRWYEVAALLIVTAALFRPGFFMDQVSPAFKNLEMETFVSGEVMGEPGYTVRFHVTRSTNYGDRFKLFRIPTPDLRVDNPGDLYGLSLEKAKDGRFAIVNLVPKGLAESGGIELGDFVTAVDVEQVGQPDKRWIYLPALGLLVLVAGLQFARRRREQTA